MKLQASRDRDRDDAARLVRETGSTGSQQLLDLVTHA